MVLLHGSSTLHRGSMEEDHGELGEDRSDESFCARFTEDDRREDGESGGDTTWNDCVSGIVGWDAGNGSLWYSDNGSFDDSITCTHCSIDDSWTTGRRSTFQHVDAVEYLIA